MNWWSVQRKGREHGRKRAMMGGGGCSHEGIIKPRASRKREITGVGERLQREEGREDPVPPLGIILGSLASGWC